MGSEDQALTVLSKKRKTNHHRGKHSHPNKFNKNQPKFRCFTCDERGHYARDCPKNKSDSHKKKGNKKRNHAHTKEDDEHPKKRNHAHTTEDDEHPKKRIKHESDDSSSDEEYVLISALTGTVIHGSNDWLIDSGASKHMTGFQESFMKLSKHESPRKVKLGDDY